MNLYSPRLQVEWLSSFLFFIFDEANRSEGQVEVPSDQPHSPVLHLAAIKVGRAFFGAVYRRLSRFHVRRRNGDIQVACDGGAPGKVGTREQTTRTRGSYQR